MSGPRFDELVGSEIEGEERERLERVHELLVEAGPPAQVTPRLAAPPRLRRRPRTRALLLAAALALAGFAGGWAARGDDGFDARRVVPMHATAAAPDASAQIRLGHPDGTGNWEMLVDVSGLKPLPEDGYYVLLLTVDGEPVVTCGSFKVDESGEAHVRLGASYSLSKFDGWVVRPYVRGRDRLNETVVLTTA